MFNKNLWIESLRFLNICINLQKLSLLTQMRQVEGKSMRLEHQKIIEDLKNYEHASDFRPSRIRPHADPKVPPCTILR